MVERLTIRALLDKLEAERFRAIESLTAEGGNLNEVSTNALQRIALLHGVLMAVRDEIATHEVKVGGGSEQPLK